MKNSIIRIGTLLLIGTIGTSCSNDTPHSLDQTTGDSTETITSELTVNPHGLVLIDNQKWDIDEGMRISIHSIEDVVASYECNTIEDYHTLSSEIGKLTQAVISSCTMQGQAHDELHKWLIPFIDLRKELDSTKEISAAQSIENEIANELDIFNRYFQ